jgi:prophage tail gpP-like protein
MKKLATLTTMAFLLATAGAFAQEPSTTTTPSDQTATKTAKSAKRHRAHKGHKKTTTKTPTTDTTPQVK